MARPSIPPRIPEYLAWPTIPVSYLQLLVEILAERGVKADRLFEGLPVPATLLGEPRMSALQWTRLVLRAQELARDPGLGYEYGLRMRPTAHGFLGYAAMSAATMREAIELVVRYAAAKQAAFEFRFEEGPRRSRIVLRERFPIPVLRTFFYENILLGLAQGSATLLGRSLDGFRECELSFDIKEPPYYRAWRARLPPVRFEQRVNALLFPTAGLEVRPALADPYASKAAVALCDRELALAVREGNDLAARVSAELTRAGDDGYPSLEDVAARLFLSTRTLKRKLQEEGTSFLRLRNDTRRRDACALLADTDLSVQEIAARLGYENPANFSRAFVRATAKTPTEYRAHVNATRG